jgi:hypothetical protein
MENHLNEQRLLAMCEATVHQEMQLRQARQQTIEALCESVAKCDRSLLSRKDMRTLMEYERASTLAAYREAAWPKCLSWIRH